MDGDHRLDWSKDWKWAKLLDNETVVNIPCRNCVGCRMAQAREWSVRCFHEALLHTKNSTDPVSSITTKIPNSCVVTLTYRDEDLPDGSLLDHEDFQLFMKRLRERRRAHEIKNGLQAKPIRFYMAGEYGSKTLRPHFHSIIFSETFDDRYTEQSRDGQTNQMSHELNDLWGKGRATVDTMSFAGAAYVAGYVAKKQDPKSIQHYSSRYTETVDEDGCHTFTPIAPEYHTMSKKPGLGHDWILQPQNMARVYENDCIEISNWRFHPPKYYDALLKKHRPFLVHDIILNRHTAWSKASEHWDKDRCTAAELIKIDQLAQMRQKL